MPFDPTKAGWTENRKSVEDEREEEEQQKPLMRIASYSALIILFAGVLGFALMAFPYVMALVSASGTDSHHHSSVTSEEMSDWWIKSDTKTKAWYRFAAGAIAGGAIGAGMLIRESSKQK